MSYDQTSYDEGRERVIQKQEYNAAVPAMSEDTLMAGMNRRPLGNNSQQKFNINDQIEQFGSFYQYQLEVATAGLKKELDEQKDLNLKLTNEIVVLNQENRDLRNKNTELQRQLDKYKDSSDHPYHEDKYILILDFRKFQDDQGKNISSEDLMKLWQKLYELAMQTDSQGEYLIARPADLTPLFLVLKEDTKLPYRYTGSIADFEYYWTENITRRFPDDVNWVNRLTFKEVNIKNNLRGNIWKDISVTSWNRLSLEGTSEARFYQKADTIKVEIERIFDLLKRK